ncbi:methyltransferase domain-containing protein [Amycolatopsis anabasis]|uniref:methyltransferase domain-containing protein n=1 Tax=Amycolatopsis anabasis TaxID=1840409 RepID=UPI001FE24BFD|nr:methyltransferase domain-containing protein [Amycolatopsis anabasis]
MTGVDSLTRDLEAAGDLPAALRPIFERVAREWFIPDQAWVKESGVYQPIDRGTDATRWLAVVNSDRVVVTQFDDGRAQWPRAGKIPTCSASMPSVVAAMLDALDVGVGHRVLEIGTGTGYNAALLAELVRASGWVTTVEVDDHLMVGARRRLTDSGYSHVRTVLGDGANGNPAGGPYDRVMATAAVHLGRVPYAWVEQTRPGGVILAPVRADLASGPLVRFIVGDDGTATGRALPIGVGFMELRSQRTPPMGSDFRWDADGDGVDQQVTDTCPSDLLDDSSARWALAVALPSCRYDVEDATDERPFEVWSLHDPVSDSWASITPAEAQDGTYLVRQAGPRRLWDAATAAYRWWKDNGSPTPLSWQWKITSEGQTVILES